MAAELIEVPLAAFVDLYMTVLKRQDCHEVRQGVDRQLALLPFPSQQKINLAVAAALRQ